MPEITHSSGDSHLTTLRPARPALLVRFQSALSRCELTQQATPKGWGQSNFALELAAVIGRRDNASAH